MFGHMLHPGPSSVQFKSESGSFTFLMSNQRIRRNEDESPETSVIQCSDVILPWLHPVELASVSSTCKAMRRVAKTVNSGRSADASRGFEKFPIPFVNAVDDQPYAFFIYSSTQSKALPYFYDPSRRRQPWGSSPASRPISPSGSPDTFHPLMVEGARGCDCEEECCVELGCPCVPCMELIGLSRECGPSCGCGKGCGNRLTQFGVTVRLKIVKDGRKGWGLHADQVIRAGQFVCEYAGELLTTKEARLRQNMYDELSSSGQFYSALLVVKEHLPSGYTCMRINIDATSIGNVARFINHSCDGGNLLTAVVRSSGALLPRLCFFACREIQEDEELTFSYGDIRLGPKVSQCFCGTSACVGTMPSEYT